MRAWCWGKPDRGAYCDLEGGHDGPHVGCQIESHGPTCEAHGMHIRARDAKGCAQFQDGSWITKASFVCHGPHPGLRGESRPLGEADWVLARIRTGL